MMVFDRMAEFLANCITEVGAEPVELDRSFSLEGEFGGQMVRLDPRAWTGAGLDWARVARLRGGPRVQVVNAVLVPDLRRGGPILAVELLAFAGIIHLFVADLLGSQGPARDSLRQVRQQLAQNYELEPIPDWGQEAFTEDLIFLRPGKKARLTAEALETPFQSLVTAWAEEFRSPLTSPNYDTMRTHFLDVQRANEPAKPFLARMAGEEAVESLTDHYLYPRHLSARGEDAKVQGGKGPCTSISE